MTRVAVIVACTTILCLGTGEEGIADPVAITSGSIIFSDPSIFQSGPIALAGTRGFSVHGHVVSGEGRIDPLWCQPCEPGTFSVGAELGTFAIVGSATLEGVTYPAINSFSSENFVFLELMGMGVLPAVSGSTLVVHVPFMVAPNSVFRYEITAAGHTEPPDVSAVSLAGRGMATVWFSADPTLPVWEFSRMRYDFFPTPEPSTLLLLGGGLGGVLLRARKRQNTPVSGGAG